MYISAPTLDDLLMRVYKKLLSSKNRVNPTRGSIIEEIGALLEIKNPRARLSRTESRGKIFSCLGEFLWYLSGTNTLEFIRYYIPRYESDSEDGKTIFGGYGPRLLNKQGQNQINNVVSILREKPNSRRAVIQLFDSDDLASTHLEIPCTCTLQFMIRKNRLYMFTHMRSNDVFLGLPHDVFCFTMLQEIIARTLSIELGTYKHFVGSLHLYEKNITDVGMYLDEGWQSSNISMPAMPVSDPWPSVKALLKAESDIRGNRKIDLDKLGLDSYWADLIKLLQIFWHYKNREVREIDLIKENMSSQIYRTYIEKQQRRQAVSLPIQKPLDLIVAA